MIVTNLNCMNSKVCIGFALSRNQCLPRHSLTGDFFFFFCYTETGNKQAPVFICAGAHFVLGSCFTAYDTVHLNYGSLGIVRGLNIVGREENRWRCGSETKAGILC